MSIEQLKGLVPAPPDPKYTGDEDKWKQAESKLKIALPKDYKAFVDTYGSGELANFIYVFTPFTKSEHMNLVQRVASDGDVFRELKENEGDEEVPFQIYPESPGLLSWGSDGNGNFLFWLTEGEPDRWPVIVAAGRDSEFERFDIPMTEFLFKALTRNLNCGIWPEDFPNPENVAAYHVFRPSAE